MKNFLLSFFLFLPIFGESQTDHYETIINEEDDWSYFVGEFEPPTDWQELNFDDSSWEAGKGGFGYADSDDRTIIPATVSLYIRRVFTISDKNDLTEIFLDIDYDDAFVAYLNGVEISRSGITGNPPPHDGLGDNHEAVIKDGGVPERFLVSKTIFENTLQDGENVLAIQIHNQSLISSDFSARPWLSAGISVPEILYGETHPYFESSVIFNSSDLPIFIIETENGATIRDEPKTKAHLSVIHNESTGINQISDTPNVYDGNIGIEIRGNYSATLPQLPFGFETRDSSGENLNVPFFHMPEENDWILLANYNDKVMMRNVLSYHLFEKMGHYAPRTKYCEVILNGSYEGIYILTEKIKQDDGRIDIANLRPDDIEGDELTGGYVFKNDYYENDLSDSWLGDFAPESLPDKEVRFVYHDPKADDITTEQKQYLKNYVRAFETVLYGSNFEDLDDGYRSWVNVSSFIDYLIISELSRNVDAYKKSKFYFKDKDSKGGLLNSGSVWDYDWAYKNFNGNRSNGSGWAHYSLERMYPTPNGWIERMMKDPWFEANVGNRYHSLRQTILSADYLNNFIDAQHDILQQGQARHYDRWKILGINVGTPEGDEPQPDSFAGEVSKFKEWIRVRLEWLDNHMPEATSKVAESESSASVRVFPNPAGDYFYLEGGERIEKVEVFDSTGRLLKSINSDFGFADRVDVSELESGVYFLRIISDGILIKTFVRN